MRNDVTIPPETSEAAETPVISESSAKEVRMNSIPPPDGLKADVTLFDHPNLAPTGAGNFWLLGLIGLFALGAVGLVLWLVFGLMK